MEVPLPNSLRHHRIQAASDDSVVRGTVRWSPVKSLWFTGMALAAGIGGLATISWVCLGLFAASTAAVLLLGHSLGSHRKLIHDSYQCPKWLEYTLVYFGVQVGLAGPIGLLRQHELRDYAQRLPDCHPYLRHGTSFWRDAWWQLHCELVLDQAPTLHIEPRIAQDRFYRFLDRTWMLQQLPVAVLLFAWGGWAFVFWGTCARVTAGVLGHWLIGHFAHNHGGMHYEVSGAAVQGRNIRFTSLLTMGESWHNNHHAFPGSARLGLFAGEWDPGWWVLMVLRRLGLVWSVRLPAAMPARAELQPCDDTARARPATVVPAVSTREVLRLCWQSDPKAWMEGPAVPVPPWRMQRWLGPHVRFDLQPGTQRLLLHTHAGLVRGLPALCVALATRGLPGRLAAMAMAPAALAFEGLRSSLDMA
jgi:stearoyl-CoA desaturase (delta-9 desaturase)